MSLKAKTSGQISVFIIFSLIPMFTLFAFVVNIGMLVNAKISLQNAADMAAYAGAATQARQLTDISHLNYQMRQIYKKFLFKYYVMGNISLRCFPRASGALPPGCPSLADAANFNWTNPGGAGFPGVPSVCINLSRESNQCQLAKPVPIIQPPSCIALLDPACAALKQAAAQIGKIQQLSCEANSTINTEVLAHWLYSTSFEHSLKSRVELGGLLDDLGLIPEELLNYGRIQTLQSYVNAKPQTVTLASLKSALENEADQAKVERSILAFKSALNNLNENVFDHSSIALKELLPSTEMLNLNEIRTDFTTYYALMDSKGGDGKVCNMKLEPMQAKPIVGVYKRDDSYVYYAVRLTAKAKLLFNPFPIGNPDGDGIELTAYAAAAPFGSRIGPKLAADDFRAKGNAVTGDPKPVEVYYPALKVADDKSFETMQVLRDYNQTLVNAAVGSGKAAAIEKEDFERAKRAAMMPDQIEVGKYNIPVDLENEKTEFHSYFRSQTEAGANEATYTFWAPVTSFGGQTKFLDDIKAELANISISFFGTSKDSTTTVARGDLTMVFTSKLSALLNDLQTRRNYTIARINDPLGEAYFKLAKSRPNVQAKVTDRQQLASSFTTDRDYNFYEHGRDGYSVKFISFRSLVAAPNTLTNFPAEKKAPMIKENFQGDQANLLKLTH